MNLINITMESIIYNRVGLKDFLNRGGFSKYPGIKVSRKGMLYLTQDGKSAPLMLDCDAGDIVVRGSYKRGYTEGFKLLTVLPDTFSNSASELFSRWASARQLNTDEYRILLQDKGATYITYKHDLEAPSFPIELGSFGIIPSIYCIDTEPKTAGISYRVCPSHFLTFTSLPPQTSDDVEETDFIAESDSKQEPPAKKARTSRSQQQQVQSGASILKMVRK